MLLREINEMVERPLMAPTLYHGTSIYNARLILEGNTIAALTGHSGKRLGRDEYRNVMGVSLSRSARSAFEFGRVIFALDAQKLRQRTRLIPMDYWSNEAASAYRMREEAEEFAVGPIRKVESYLRSISVRKLDYDFFLAKRPEYIAAAVVFEHPKLVVFDRETASYDRPNIAA